MRGTAFPSGETGMPATAASLHTPNKYQPALIGPPLLEANIDYRVTAPGLARVGTSTLVAGPAESLGSSARARQRSKLAAQGVPIGLCHRRSKRSLSIVAK